MPNPPKTKPKSFDRTPYESILAKPWAGAQGEGVDVIEGSGRNTPANIHYSMVSGFGNKLISGKAGGIDAAYVTKNNRLLLSHPSGMGYVDVGVYNPDGIIKKSISQSIIPAVKNNTPNPSDVIVKPTEFGTAGTYNPNTGINKNYDNEVVDPIVQKYKNGGIIGKLKGYADGGQTSDNSKQVAALAGMGAGIAGEFGGQALDRQFMDEQGRYKRNPEIDQNSPQGLLSNFYNKGTLAGGVKGAGKGAALGSSLGPEGALIGAGVGLLAGSVTGTLKANKDAKSIRNDFNVMQQQEILDEQAKKQAVVNLSLNKQLTDRALGYKNGGKIEGAGTGKSDSITAKIKPNSFVIPAENSATAEVIRKVVLKAPVKKANLNQSGGTKVKLSDGEHVFTPEEKVKIESKGISLDALAPNAKKELQGDKQQLIRQKEMLGFTEGGNVNDPPSKSDIDKILKGKKEQDLKNREALIAARDRILADKNPKNKYYNEVALKDTEDKIKQLNDAYGEPVKTQGASAAAKIGVPKETVKSVNAKIYPKPSSNKVISKKEVIEPDYLGQKTVGLDIPSTDVDLIQDKTPITANEQIGYNNRPSSANGLKIGDLGKISDVAVSAIPFAQTAFGLQQLKKLGKRPVDTLDEDYLKSIDSARGNLNLLNADAKFGFTPEEQAMINNENQNLTNAQRYSARNLSGGSAANAYNLERGAINNAFDRALKAKVQNRALMMEKQGIARDQQKYIDELVANKANMNRRLFGDKTNAWQQNQEAGSSLVGAGLQNLIGMKRYQSELDAMKKTQGLRDSWLNTLPQ